MCLPLIIFGGVFLSQIIRNWNGINDIDMFVIESIIQDSAILFMQIGEGALSGLVNAVVYFLGVLGITELGAYVLVISQIIYMIVIELIWLLYDVIIFIPRACRSIVERGM